MKSRRAIGKCEKCGAKADFYRCAEHYKCDDCGTTDNLITDSVGVFCHSCRELRIEKRIAEFSDDTDCTSEIVCPWCGHEHSDSWEMGSGEMECHDCGREFQTERDVSVSYSTSRI